MSSYEGSEDVRVYPTKRKPVNSPLSRRTRTKLELVTELEAIGASYRLLQLWDGTEIIKESEHVRYQEYKRIISELEVLEDTIEDLRRRVDKLFGRIVLT